VAKKEKAYTEGRCSFCKEWVYGGGEEGAKTMPQHKDPNTGRNCFGMSKGPIARR
jgi:hypothetical protein